MLILCASGILPGTAEAGELRYIETSRPEFLNPVGGSRNVIGMRALQLVYRGLISQDEFGTWMPEMALTMPEYDAANGELVFRLREGLKWPDEAPVTAADVVHSYHVYRDERSRFGNANLLEVFAGVRADGDHSVRFKLIQPDSNAVARAAARAGFFVMPKHLIGDDTYISETSEFNAAPMGTGPFVVTALEDNLIEFDANPWYYKATPEIDNVQLVVNPSEDVHFNLLLSGFVDVDPVVRPADLPALQASAEISVRPYNSQSWHGFAYNTKRGVLRFREVRQAFSISFDRQEALDANFAGRGVLVSGPYTNASFCYNPDIDPYPYDPESANQILDELGMLDLEGNDGIREHEGEPIVLQMVLSKGMSQANKNVAADFAKQIEAHHVKVEVDYQIESVWYQRVFIDRDFDITFVSWKFDDASNIYPLFSRTQQAPGQYNVCQYENDQVEAQLEIFRTATDDAERTDAGQRLHRLLHEETPYTFLWTLEHSSAYRRDNIKKIRIQPFYFFTYIDEWELED
jgi:peptide/nickel transport system substrate-binding protein